MEKDIFMHAERIRSLCARKGRLKASKRIGSRGGEGVSLNAIGQRQNDQKKKSLKRGKEKRKKLTSYNGERSITSVLR